MPRTLKLSLTVFALLSLCAPAALAKPTPGYTEEARRAGVSGVVRVRAVLGADGNFKHTLVLRRLSHGLTEKAIEAARQVRFKPATLNGQPVSQYVILEYGFNLHERGFGRFGY